MDTNGGLICITNGSVGGSIGDMGRMGRKRKDERLTTNTEVGRWVGNSVIGFLLL